MKYYKINQPTKRDHTIVVKNFFGEGQNLEMWQLGWDLDSKIEAKTSVTRKIFDYFIEDLGRNMIFYYVKN